jgi:predicted nucleic acid-binding protein
MDEFPKHVATQKMLDQLVVDKNKLIISNQVVREYLSVVTNQKLFQRPMDLKETRDFLKNIFQGFECLEDVGKDALLESISLAQKLGISGKKLYDVFIALVMRHHNIEYIFTDNEKDFKRFDFVKVIPIKH